jgi:DNA-binding NarL/FixJ family response regulator
MINLLLVEDEPLVRRGLRMWLEREPDITLVGEASNDAEAILLAQTLHPHVVLMDLSMPPMDNITATAALSAVVPHCAIVLLSLRDDEDMRTRARVAGAVAFVGKQEGVKVLHAAIREAAKQGQALQEEPESAEQH